jgi:hypothetical protein
MEKSLQKKNSKITGIKRYWLALLLSAAVVVYAAYLMREPTGWTIPWQTNITPGQECAVTDPDCDPVKQDRSWFAVDGDLFPWQSDSQVNLRDSAAPDAQISSPSTNLSVRYADIRPGQTVIESCGGVPDTRGDPCYAVTDIRQIAAPGDPPGASSDRSGYSSAELEADRSISGQVLTSAGNGLANVPVVATADRLTGDAGVSTAARLRFHTLTDSLGRYTLEGLPDGDYTVRSSRQGVYQSGRVTVRAGVTYADIVVERSIVHEVRGQVLSESGEPLEGVSVLPNVLGQPSVLSDDNGEFVVKLATAPGVDRASLRFQRPGYREESKAIRLDAGTQNGYIKTSVFMQPVEAWTAFAGYVFDETGEPVVGALVDLKPVNEPRSYSVSTNGQGRYEFPFIEAPADYRLTIHGGNRYRDYQGTLNLTTDTYEPEIYLQSYDFGELTGQLVNPDGSPIAGFELVFRNTGSQKPNMTVTTDAAGNFSIPEAPAGEFLLASASSPAILVQGLRLNAGRSLHVPLVLDWGQHEIRGSVVDARGYPVPASQVILQWTQQTDGVSASVTRRAAADTQGNFVFTNLGPGPHSLRIDAPGFRAVAVEHDVMRQGYNLTVNLN